MQDNGVEILEVFFNTSEFPLRIKSRETGEIFTVGPFFDDTQISAVEEALKNAVPEHN